MLEYDRINLSEGIDSSVKWSVLVHFKSQPRGQNFQAQI